MRNKLLVYFKFKVLFYNSDTAIEFGNVRGWKLNVEVISSNLLSRGWVLFFCAKEGLVWTGHGSTMQCHEQGELGLQSDNGALHLSVSAVVVQLQLFQCLKWGRCCKELSNEYGEQLRACRGVEAFSLGTKKGKHSNAVALRHHLVGRRSSVQHGDRACAVLPSGKWPLNSHSTSNTHSWAVEAVVDRLSNCKESNFREQIRLRPAKNPFQVAKIHKFKIVLGSHIIQYFPNISAYLGRILSTCQYRYRSWCWSLNKVI